MRVEPPLQSLTGESLRFASANNEDGARADVGLWRCEYQQGRSPEILSGQAMDCNGGHSHAHYILLI